VGGDGVADGGRGAEGGSVPMNPSSYLYFSTYRPDPNGLPGQCPDFNDYKYGTDHPNPYMSRPVDQLVAQYTSRKVTYTLGGDDHYNNHGMDVSCAGMAEGPNRLARGNAYVAYIHKNYPNADHGEVIVPGVGHDGAAMFDSPGGRKVLFGGTTPPPTSGTPAPPTSTPPPTGAAPTAQQLLAKAQGCDDVLTKEGLQEDSGSPRDVKVCGKNGAVYFNADMDIDCDGQVTDRCNDHNGDCCFQNDTTFHQSDGEPLSAGYLPYVVLPRASDNWEWHDQGIDGGSVVAVIYNNQVTYAVFGDTDSPSKVGEASYATAQSLGIDPSPASGGVDDGVTYIVFPDKANPIESHDSAVTVGQKAAQQFIDNN
jgi:Fungal chitosanase of glycosyl hydrolase group 75